jgi:hypothetical protein
MTSSTHTPTTVLEDSLVARGCDYLLPYLPGNGARKSLMSMHASILVDSVGPPSADVCRTAASFP